MGCERRMNLNVPGEGHQQDCRHAGHRHRRDASRPWPPLTLAICGHLLRASPARRPTFFQESRHLNNTLVGGPFHRALCARPFGPRAGGTVGWTARDQLRESPARHGLTQRAWLCGQIPRGTGHCAFQFGLRRTLEEPSVCTRFAASLEHLAAAP